MSKHTVDEYGAHYRDDAHLMPIRKARKVHECRYCESAIVSGSHYLNDLRDASYGESGERCCIPCAIRRGYLVDRRRGEVQKEVDRREGTGSGGGGLTPTPLVPIFNA